MDGVEIRGLDDARAMIQAISKNGHFATVVAFTRTGQRVKAAETQLIKSTFDRPTPWTVNSVFLQPAKVKDIDPFARVYIKDFGQKGTPAVKYLFTQIHGGKRSKTRFESALRHKMIKGKPVLGSNEYVVPSKYVKKNQYGNVSPGLFVQILSGLGAFSEAGYIANRTASSTKSAFFVNTFRSRGKMMKGIFRRKTTSRNAGRKHERRGEIYTGSSFGHELLFVVVKQPSYKKLLPFYEEGLKVADKWLLYEWDIAFLQAMAPHRKR